MFWVKLLLLEQLTLLQYVQFPVTKSYLVCAAKNTITATSIAKGMVTSQPSTILPSALALIFPPPTVNFCATPTPTTAPTKQCEVETGIPNADEAKTATAAPICVEKDFDGVKMVILVPTVSIVLDPSNIMPATNPIAPIAKIHEAVSGVPETAF